MRVAEAGCSRSSMRTQAGGGIPARRGAARAGLRADAKMSAARETRARIV
jgi:hypothetical protein